MVAPNGSGPLASEPGWDYLGRMPEIDLEPDEYRRQDEEPPQPRKDGFGKWVMLILLGFIAAWFKTKT